MASILITMRHDPVVNNTTQSGLTRAHVRIIQDALHEVLPDLFPERVFTWEQAEQAATPFCWPTVSRHVTQPFGARPEYYGKWNLPGHEGVDIAGRLGAWVYAAADGRIISAAWQHDNLPPHNYGRQVRIEHEIGDQTFVTIYAHLSEALVDTGQGVKRSEVIGKIGSTGNSTGPHLHFGVKLRGATEREETSFPYDFVDPAPYLGIER